MQILDAFMNVESFRPAAISFEHKVSTYCLAKPYQL